MFPSSRTTNAQQHAQRTQFPSIIRTRSQQQQPLAPVDMYASPLKEAMRNLNHNHHHTQQNYLGENVPLLGTMIPDDGSDDEMLLSPSHKKRASSPSFAANDHAGKRIRVFGQSSKGNSLSRRHSEESLGTPRKDSAHTPAKASHTPLRTVSTGSPGKGIIHLDLTKLPQSPSKPLNSPARTFKIMTDEGQTMRVPVTPGKRAFGGGSGLYTPNAKPSAFPSPSQKNAHVQEPPYLSTPPAAFMQQSTPLEQPLTSPHHTTSPMSMLKGTGHSHDTSLTRMLPFTRFQPQSTPIRPGLLGGGSLFGGSPLTPLPPTPNGVALMRRPSIPHSTSCERLTTIASKSGSGPPLPSSSLAAAGQDSPTKSRIPVPSCSSAPRLPRPSSSLSISTLLPAGPSSPVKTPRHPSLVNTKPRVKGKVKSGVRSKAPLTRLAAKRGVRRTSSLGATLRAGTRSSSGSNIPPPTSEKAGPSNSNPSVGVVPGTEGKKSLVTSSRLSTENAPLPRIVSTPPPSVTPSASPTKPTPLSALSTALQKLLVTPPAAPAPRSRPSTSLGFARSTLASAQRAQAPEASRGANGSNVIGKTPVSSGRSGVSLPRSKTSLGHSGPFGPPKGVGRMGLPLRRPITPTGLGKPAPGAGAAFVSKQTTLSTVPASPSRSAAPPSEGDALPDAPNIQVNVVDVDAWVSPAQSDSGKGKAKEVTSGLEYLVPLADEPRPKLQPPPELVSPSRRASQASLSLTQSLSLPRGPSAPRPQIARSASTSAAAQSNPRTPVKTRGRTRPPPAAPEPTGDGNAVAKNNDPMGGKRSNARMPGSLDVLKDCIIFVDVRTEEGEDAAALFVDMLRGLGARILAKPGKSCTHLVYKSGLPSTITKYKLLPEPRPLPVSIGWVVECVEKRERVDETRFLVNLNEIGVAGGAQRRRSMQPKQMRTMTLGQLDSGEPAEISVRADSSFTSEEPSTSGLILAGLSPPARSPDDNLPPLQRARQRSLHLARE